MSATRRQFLATGFRAGLALPATGLLASAARAAAAAPLPGADADATGLAQRFPDLARHFIFEYYPWYGGPPDYDHWTYLDRHPPIDIASPYMPQLGPYDVRSTAVLEQHARWIHEAGVGAVALSWWGRGSWQDQRVPLIMDVMRDYGIKVTFALEPYADDRALHYADDVMFLLREYGDKRRFDTFLLPENADGASGPVFKGFACILPETSTDCLGITRPVALYTPDAEWRRQTDTLRHTLRADFDHITLLADSLNFGRTPASGFDGIGIYDNYIGPERYSALAGGASAAGLVFSFNVNPGYYQIEPRDVSGNPCYAPRPFAPATQGLDLRTADGRELAARLSSGRIQDSFAATVAVQTDPALANDRRGFFLVYINSFNEWHEGHAFEPMKDAADLTPAERAHGYANPIHGNYRLRTLSSLVRSLMAPRTGPDFRRRPRNLDDAAAVGPGPG
jgi:hypothetical protein